jgi:hypothetical protein
MLITHATLSIVTTGKFRYLVESVQRVCPDALASGHFV